MVTNIALILLGVLQKAGKNHLPRSKPAYAVRQAHEGHTEWYGIKLFFHSMHSEGA